MDHAEKIKYRIQEDSWLACMAAFLLKGQKVAIVVGQTIYLHGASEAELLTSTTWLRHELMHIQQYQRYGTFLFVLKYLREVIYKGYRNNRYEIEAREAERIIGFEKKFEVVSRRRSL